MNPYRVGVTGSRDWRRLDVIRAALAAVLAAHPDAVLVSGHAREGADMLAERAWAALLGYRAADEAWRAGRIERYPADWGAPCREECKRGHRRSRRSGGTYCPAAGNYRNQEMVDTGPDACVAFFQPGAANAGTSDCVRRYVAAGIPVEPHGQVPEAITGLFANDQTGALLLW